MKVLRGEVELSANDVEEIPKGMTPGEWFCLNDASAHKRYIAYVNPYTENFYKIKILKIVHPQFNSQADEKQMAEETIVELLEKALGRRNIFSGYEQGARLVYGISDFMPGLIVDKYKRYIFIQINTAGLDRFRDLIHSTLQRKFQDAKVLFFDNEEYRKAEVLPVHEKAELEEDLEVQENGINYIIPKTIMQKIGYYYDHRENRNRLKNLLLRLNVKKEKGLDLFSYVGSWGLHLLSAGVSNVKFVDQGQMQNAVEGNLALNGFIGRGSFIRADVFKFLDAALAEGERFDVIVSDPPAFTKSDKNKINAVLGYEKLHLKAMRLLNEEGIFVAASCTHYVSFEELDKTVQDAALKNGQKLQLLDLGGQGFDHPMSGLKDKSFYIKYLVYHVHRG
jgi:23S rRNA (cytosine1962-C5)-methyltransferase